LANQISYHIFGESHGNGIGVVIEHLPAGVKLNFDEIEQDMTRRRAKSDGTSTTRIEADAPEILSGVFEGYTTGAPLAALIRNQNTRSGDYTRTKDLARPSHADYTGNLRYRGYQDYRGGGNFSGRLTAPLVFAGAVAKQVLKTRGITVGAHILQIGNVKEPSFDPVAVNAAQLKAIAAKPFSVIDDEIGEQMKETIRAAGKNITSVGGIIQCAIVGVEPGIGQNDFDSVESIISRNLFAVPAVKGIEFGLGFGFADAYAHEVNDPFVNESGEIKTTSNYNGGVLGGITTGMPIVFQTVFKPTASIAREQQTINMVTGENATIAIKGRHDPCIVGRAAVVVEAAAALAMLELLPEIVLPRKEEQNG
jgi:chorismate synthase